MIKQLLTSIFLIFLCFALPSCNNSDSNQKAPEQPVYEDNDGPVFLLGILPLRNPSEMQNRFEPTAQYLREETGLNIQLRFYPTKGKLGGFSDVVRDISTGKVHFAYLASVTAVQAHANGPVIPFACAQKNGSPTYQGDLVVKGDSPYMNLEDLKGKKVAGSSASSTSGNVMPTAMMKAKGIDQTTYFDGGMQYPGSHDKAVEAVIAGIIDACFINEATFNKYKEKHNLRSIWKHDPVPEFPFVVNTEKVSLEELTKVRQALVRMHEIDLDGVKAANPKYEKWVAIDWNDYVVVKNVIDRVYGPVFYDLERWFKE